MKIDKKRFGDVIILKLTGELDVYNLQDLTEMMDKLVEAGDTKYVLNTHLLKFINSAALGYLTSLWKRLEAEGGELVFAQPSKFMKRTIGVTGIPVPVFDTDEEALLHLKGRGAEQAAIAAPEEADPDLTGQRTVRFWANKQEDAARVGRIVSLYPDSLKFHYAPKDALDPVELGVAVGTTLDLKFAQPFILKGHFFTPSGKVTRVEELETDEGKLLAIQVEFADIAPEDKKYLEDHFRAQQEFRKGLGAEG